MTNLRPVRMGIIGLGAMGAEMLAAATDHPDVLVPIAADHSEPILRRRRDAHPDLVLTTDPAEVIASDALDAVYIATPPAHHSQLALAALRRGLAVLCEKPLATSLADGQAMVDAASATGLASAVNFALSDRNAVLEVERALSAGEVGQVRAVEVRLQLPRWPRDFQAGAAWLAGRDQGGFVREVFSHFAYLTDRLLGPLQPVYVGVDHPAGAPTSAETAAFGLLRAGDVPVYLSGCSGIASAESYEWILYGTRRSYLLRDWAHLLASDGGDWTPVPLTGPRGSEATRLALFARAVRGEQVADLADFAAAFRVQQVVEAFHGA